MWTHSVLDYLKSGPARTRPGRARRVRRLAPRKWRAQCRLRVELLEDRCLLSGGELSFADPVDYGAGRSPRSVAVGDFRGVGVQDLAVANSGSNDVSIFLGNGDGTFRLAETVVVGVSPYYVTTGHFHDPGILDLAVADSGSNEVSILLGHGDGSFGLPHGYSVGRNPQSIAVGDFNGDGISDLAVANHDSSSVSILLGNGDGTFAPASNIAVGGAAAFVVAADFAGNGRQDLAVAAVDSSPYQRGTVSILLGNGDGTFRAGQSLAVGRGLTSMVAHDFSGDGVPELAVAGSLTDTVSILLGRGDGTFTPDRNYPVEGRVQSMAVGDFNGDGVADLVTVSDYAAVSVLPGNGDGTFQTTRYFWGGANPVSVAVGDFNRDGADDLAIAQNFTNQVSVLLNNGPQQGDGVAVFRDIVYYNGEYSNPERENLDVYVPPDRTDFPVVFLVFGGMYRNGAKSRQAYLAQTLAREGYGVVAINHRVADGSLQQIVFPANEVDVARALSWTYHHIADYGGDPGKIVLMGHSSGAMLVSLLATDRSYLAAQQLSPDVIKGVVGVSSGTYDMRIIYNNPLLPDLTDVFGDLEGHWNASPLKYVDGTQPPFLVLYASNDMPGFAQDSTAFYQALVDHGSEAELHMIPGRNHQMIIGDAAHPGDPAREFILRFIARHTGGDPDPGPTRAGFHDRGKEGGAIGSVFWGAGGQTRMTVDPGPAERAPSSAFRGRGLGPGLPPSANQDVSGTATDPRFPDPPPLNRSAQEPPAAPAHGRPRNGLDYVFANFDGRLLGGALGDDL
jgi:acetyl esterase/lipase